MVTSLLSSPSSSMSPSLSSSNSSSSASLATASTESSADSSSGASSRRSSLVPVAGTSSSSSLRSLMATSASARYLLAPSLSARYTLGVNLGFLSFLSPSVVCASKSVRSGPTSGSLMLSTRMAASLCARMTSSSSSLASSLRALSCISTWYCGSLGVSHSNRGGGEGGRSASVSLDGVSVSAGWGWGGGRLRKGEGPISFRSMTRDVLVPASHAFLTRSLMDSMTSGSTCSIAHRRTCSAS
mmetsp:Transcript_13123/g.37898  ORF Transcript_13123/g.37898 Transcript_13123/m.37898 type:complete len:242 (+) Transcript_13123:1312-2037(+)